MTNRTSSTFRRNGIQVGVAVALISLVPHLGRGTDHPTGLRVGSNYALNPIYNDAIVLGSNNNNPSPQSIAIGSSNNLGGSSGAGFGSLAVGSSNTLSGYTRFAFGTSNTVNATYGMAIGAWNVVSGYGSVAYGYQNQSGSGASYALAGGTATIANGQNSVAFGNNTTAPSFASVVIGQYNSSPAGQSTSGWQASDQIFVIGNGTSTTPANALEVKKDGTVTIMTVPAQGGVGMGGYNVP